MFMIGMKILLLIVFYKYAYNNNIDFLLSLFIVAA